MSRIYEVQGEAANPSHTIAYGARHTRAEAEALLAETKTRVASVGGKVSRYWIVEIDTTGLFELPPRPTPRERFTTKVTTLTPPRQWTRVRVEVMDGDRSIAAYERNYSMLQTFEPFRQGDKHFALVAPDYTATSVLDLQTGSIIASEPGRSGGFCPVGFYVPDWWDVHDGHVLPGSKYWDSENEWPSAGDFGFVWGCIWGDDSSWKVQYLDLSQIQNRQIQREERFGYLKLASRPDAVGREFIRVSRSEGRSSVEFAVLETYDLQSGMQFESQLE